MIQYWTKNEKDINNFWKNIPNLILKEKKQIRHKLGQYAINGFPNNIEKFRHLWESVYEIKPTKQIRLVGYYSKRLPKRFIIVDILRKKKGSFNTDEKNRIKNNANLSMEELNE